MLMIFVMATLSLNSVQTVTRQRQQTTQPHAAYSTFQLINITTASPYSTRTKALILNSTTPTILYNRTDDKPQKSKKRRRKILIKKRRKRPQEPLSAQSNNLNWNIHPKPEPMQIYYAQPLNLYDLNNNYQLQTTPVAMVNYDQFSSAIQLPYDPYANQPDSVYKTLPANEYYPDQYSHNVFQPQWNMPMLTTTEKPRLAKIPLYDPFNALKPYRRGKTHRQKVVSTMRPIVVSATTVPPISVTHVYKYTDDTAVPFVGQQDDSIDLPALSLALNEHFHERNGQSLKMARSKAPMVYNMPTIMALPTMTPELDIIKKFNDDVLKIQSQPFQPLQSGISTHKPDTFEYEEGGTSDDKTYSDDDVKKALQYIQKLKKSKSPARGSKKFNSKDSEDDERPRKNKKNDPFFDDVEQLEEDEDDDRRTRKKDRENEETSSRENDDDGYNKVVEEVDEEESRRKVIKADNIEDIKYQESHVPTSNEETVSHPDFSQGTSLGGAESDDRVEFQMHGLRGPESYKFGFDTGKGENRQFRYEERDSTGNVKGHYGYYDKNGQLLMFNYEADHEHGYRLERANTP